MNGMGLETHVGLVMGSHEYRYGYEFLDLWQTHTPPVQVAGLLDVTSHK